MLQKPQDEHVIQYGFHYMIKRNKIYNMQVSQSIQHTSEEAKYHIHGNYLQDRKGIDNFVQNKAS